MHIDTQAIIGLGVGLHLLAALAKALFRTPKQQAQIDVIETKIDTVLGALQAGVTAGAAASAIKGDTK